MFKLIKIIIGINLISYSLMFYIMFLNIFNLGFTISDYFLKIITNIETLLIIPGVVFIWHALYQKKRTPY